MDAKEFSDPVFRGCTHPVMFKGVPMMPFLGITGIFMLLGMWLFTLFSGFVALFLILPYIPTVIAMRTISSKDDQRLYQLFKRARMRVKLKSSRERWGAITYAPVSYKKRVNK